MTPAQPVIPGVDLPVTIFAENQPEYLPLPAYRFGDAEKTVLSRWKLTWGERLRVLLTGNLWLYSLTFGNPLQPLLPTVKKPEITQARL